MQAPFDVSDDGDQPAVYGYGDPNGDFHVIGDHPGIHGGRTTGIPFTETESGERVQQLLRETGFVTGPESEPTLENGFLSYVHLCTPPAGELPDPVAYDRLERFFDAELRAVNAHILLPVGSVATDRVLSEYTTQRSKVTLDMDRLHATEIRGRGFLVVPIADPAEWSDDQADRANATITSILGRDYRQTKGVATLVG